jgi:hypothetical protein
VEALAALLVLGLALARDGQDVTLDVDRDVALVEARQVGLQREVVLGLDEVHRRQPAARASVARCGGRIEERVEEAVHLALQ